MKIYLEIMLLEDVILEPMIQEVVNYVHLLHQIMLAKIVETLMEDAHSAIIHIIMTIVPKNALVAQLIASIAPAQPIVMAVTLVM